MKNDPAFRAIILMTCGMICGYILIDLLLR